MDWIDRNLGDFRPGIALKTDLFEEANGDDQLLFALAPRARVAVGIDSDARTAARARARSGTVLVAAADARRLPFRSGAVDLVISNSTLDHFEKRTDLDAAVAELARVLAPGGRLLITLDNPWNPLYQIFHKGLKRYGVSFELGHTASLPRLRRMLSSSGLEIMGSEWLIHNPRFLSTLLFLSLRSVMGASAGRPIGWLLRAFALLGRSPVRPFSACFVAACARKPGLSSFPTA
jgi:SAM-dependent methyltransferase